MFEDLPSKDEKGPYGQWDEHWNWFKGTVGDTTDTLRSGAINMPQYNHNRLGIKNQLFIYLGQSQTQSPAVESCQLRYHGLLPCATQPPFLPTPPNWVLLLLSLISRFLALGLVTSNSSILCEWILMFLSITTKMNLKKRKKKKEEVTVAYTRVVRFQRYQQDRKYKTHKHSITFWTITVTLALNTAM